MNLHWLTTSPGLGGPLGVLPSGACTGVGGDVAYRRLGQVQHSEDAPDRAVFTPHDVKALGLGIQPALGDRRRLLALRGQHHRENRLPVLGPRRLRVVPAPGLPVDRREDARQVPEQELLVEQRLLLFPASGRLQTAVDVGADTAEDPLVALEVTPSQVTVEDVASQVMRVQPLRPSLDEGQLAKPGEQLVGIVDLQSISQQRLCRHPGERAHLQGTAVQPAGGDVDEPSHQGSHEVRRQRVGSRLPTAGHHIGQQRQPERMAVRDLDDRVVQRGIDTTRVQVLAALGRAEIAEGDHAKQLTPGGISTPGRGRWIASRDHGDTGVRQPGKQPAAKPAVDQRQPLIAVKQHHHPRRAGPPNDGTVPVRHLKNPAQPLEHRGR